MTPPARGFRRRNARALHEAHAGPNMTPMVDVVMVILIFFMASTAIMGPEWLLRTALARKGTTHAAAPTPETDTRLRIELRRASANAPTPASSATNTPNTPSTQTLATLRERAGATSAASPADQRDLVDLPFAQLRAALEQAAQRAGRANLIVLIDPADDVPYEEIVQLHEWCAELNIQRVGLAP